MDTYCPISILRDTYSYMTWYELRNINNVPESIWQNICNRFCDDSGFRVKYIEYRDFLKLKSSRKLFLLIVNHMMMEIKRGREKTVPIILWKDKDFAMIAGLYSSEVLLYGPKDLRTNPEFALKVIMRYPRAIGHIDNQLKSNKDFANKVLEKYPLHLSFFSHEITSDRELVWRLIQSDPRVFRDVNQSLRLDQEMVLEAMRDRENWNYIPSQLRSNSDFMLTAIKLYPDAIIETNYMLRQSQDFLLDAAKLGADVLGVFGIDSVTRQKITADVLLSEPCIIDYCSI